MYIENRKKSEDEVREFMNRKQLESLLFKMTDIETGLMNGVFSVETTIEDLNDLSIKEGEVYVLVESDMENAPGYIPGYENAAKQFGVLNIVASKHVRFSEVPLHRHEFVEMNYVLSGEINIVINDQDMVIKEGDLCIMDSNTTHAIKKTGTDDLLLNILMPKTYFDMTFLTTFMDLDLIGRFFADLLSEKNKDDQYLLIHCQTSDLVKDFVENIFCEFLEPSIGSSNMIRYYIGLTLIEAVRSYQSYAGESKTDKGSNDLTDILYYIDEHCVDCNLKAVAEKFNYSPSHLSKKLKKHMGKSFQELVSDQRLNRVAAQLKNTDKPIAQIAATCGYHNLAFFYKKFHDKYGSTPKAFRESINRIQYNNQRS